MPVGERRTVNCERLPFSLTIFSETPIYVVKLDVAILNVGQDVHLHDIG